MKRLATNSMLSTGKRCLEKFALRYVDGLVPAKMSKAPSFGTLFHGLVSGLWSDGDAFSYGSIVQDWRDSLIADAQERVKQLQSQLGIVDDSIVVSTEEKCDEIAQQCIELFKYYRATVWEKERDQYDPLYVEQTFNVPLTTRGDKRHPVWRFGGKWDLVLYNLVANKPVVRDYKTTVRTPESFAMMAELDTQPISYIYASLYLATHQKKDKRDQPQWPSSLPPAFDFELEIIRKKVPKEPPLLKRGGLSKAQNIDTTPELFQRAIDRHGLNPADYADVLQRLEKRGPSFHYRHRVSIGSEEIRRWANETRWCLEKLREIELHRDRTYRADPMTCQNMYGRRCEYHSLCFGDAAAARADYVVRKIHAELDDEPATGSKDEA